MPDPGSSWRAAPRLLHACGVDVSGVTAACRPWSEPLLWLSVPPQEQFPTRSTSQRRIPQGRSAFRCARARARPRGSRRALVKGLLGLGGVTAAAAVLHDTDAARRGQPGPATTGPQPTLPPPQPDRFSYANSDSAALRGAWGAVRSRRDLLRLGVLPNRRHLLRRDVLRRGALLRGGGRMLRRKPDVLRRYLHRSPDRSEELRDLR